MIKFDWKVFEDDLSELIYRFNELPRHIAKKNMGAAMKRALRDGVPILKKYTPPIGSGRGRRKKGARSTGALRRSVTVKSKTVTGTHGTAVVYGVLGYRYGWDSRKAIWQEFGTKKMQGKLMVQHALRDYKGPAITILTRELGRSLEAAAREVAGGRNPTRTFT